MFRRLAVVLVAAVLLSCGGAVSASAADMPVKAPVYKVSPAAIPSSWSGFYLGGAVGMRGDITDPTVTSQIYNQTGNPPINDLLDCGTPPCIDGGPFNGSSFRASPYLGYNLQVAPRWVVGLEVDFGWANRTSTFSGGQFPAGFLSGSAADIFSVKTTWDASARGRIGYLVNPWFMLYVTGGPSWIRLETTSNCSSAGFSNCAGTAGFNGMMPLVITQSATRSGLTLGGGGEARLWGNWIARAEYRYADYGTFSATDVRTCAAPCGFGPTLGSPAVDTASYSVHVRTHTALVGLAYKFGDPIGPAPAADPAVMPGLVTKAPSAATAPSWTGLYAVLGVGMRSTISTATFTGGTFSSPLFGTAPLVVCPTCVVSEPLDDTAFRISPYVGLNWQLGRQWLVGVEGDWGWADRTTTLTGMDYPETNFMTSNAADKFAVRTTWDASARGRLGVLVTPSLLAYVTGGAAWQHVETTSTCATSRELCAPFIFIGGGSGFFIPGVITHSTDKVGPTVGVGLEARLWQNSLARAEYRYADFGTISNTDIRTCAA